MKINSILFFLLLLIASITVNAQNKSIGKAVFQTPTIQCDKCKARIETYLARQYGVTAVKVDVKKKVTAVNWITDRTDAEIIKAAIANVGYDADDVTAEESAYSKLPACCKKPETNKKADLKD